MSRGPSKQKIHQPDSPSVFDTVVTSLDAAAMARRTTSLGEAIKTRLRLAQSELGLSIRGLADQAHVTAPTIQRIRLGKGGGCAAGLLADVAKALGVSPAWLVYGTGPRIEPESDADAIRAAIDSLPKRERDRLFEELCNELAAQKAQVAAPK